MFTHRLPVVYLLPYTIYIYVTFDFWLLYDIMSDVYVTGKKTVRHLSRGKNVFTRIPRIVPSIRTIVIIYEQ